MALLEAMKDEDSGAENHSTLRIFTDSQNVVGACRTQHETNHTIRKIF